MSNRKIKIRRIVKLAFIEIYKDKFHKLFLLRNEIENLPTKEKCRIFWGSNEFKEIAELAKKKIGYSGKTSSVDIVHNMFMKYKEQWVK